MATDGGVWVAAAGRRRKIRFLNPDVPLFNTTDPIATHVAAMGPKSRQLAAELGCPWITLYVSPEQLAGEMTAMEAASKNAREMINLLTIQYNKARQERITKELLDIVGGAEALRQSVEA